MGSKKHKKNKSDKRERYEDRGFCLERPPSLKLILKVSGNNSTPEHGNDSPGPAYGIHPDNIEYISNLEYSERPKKLKKKKKKKDREKKHKHNKEKRLKQRNDSSQEDISPSEDSSQLHDTIIRYTGMITTNCLSSTPVTKPIIPNKAFDDLKQTEQQQQPPSSPSSSISIAQNATIPLPQQSQQQQILTEPILFKELSPLNTVKSVESIKSPTSNSDTSVGREPRTCVLKLKQSKTPLSKLLDHLLRSLEKKDPHQFFAWPVTDDIAPGYSSIISDPMDFLSIREKVDENQYSTLQEFIDDFKLMCENAIKYNHNETVYHKAAKRLLHTGGRMLQPENLLRSLRPLMMYMKELSSRELGFELTQHNENQENDNQIVDSADEGMSTGAEEGSAGGGGNNNIQALEEDDKIKTLRKANDPRTKFEPFVDDLTAEEVLAQVQNAAKIARKRVLTEHQSAKKMGFLRQNKDGTTSMKIIVSVDNDRPERVITLGALTGKLQQGTGQLQGFREDRRNNAKIVKPLNYGQFCSYAPVYDSRFSNLNKEETELVLNTYGDERCTEYAKSIIEFSKDSCYAHTIANRLLDVLTNGEHGKTTAQLMENQRQRYEQHEIDKVFPINSTIDNDNNKPNNTNEDSNIKYDNVKIDFESLYTLNELGVDCSFLNPLEQNYRSTELHKKLQEQLHTNSTLIERLQQVQTERLSQPLPQHLSHITHPNTDEIELAVQITTNLTEMAKQLPPESISAPHALRKAMGLSDVGLSPIIPPRLSLNNILMTNTCTQVDNINAVDIDTTPIPMDLEPDSMCSDVLHNSAVPSQVDLENELREFLEGGTHLTHTDDVGIEQMLMD